jgi:protein-S-isoprenylcysteine O-methyltransferase Ste14
MSSDEQSSQTSHFGQGKLPGEHPYGDLGQIIFFFVFLIVWILDSFVFKLSTVLTATIPFAIRLLGAALFFGLSLYLYRASHHIVDEARESDRKLIQSGPFAKVRHPLYLSALLLYLAFIVATLSLVSFGLWLFIFLFYNFIAAYEENKLLDIFGQDYSDYMKRASRWFPF